MVTLVWFILSLFEVCEFTWLPIFIDATVSTVFFAYNNVKNNSRGDMLCLASLGVAVFAFYKFFFALSISPWWIILSPIAVYTIVLFPGGFTIVNLLFRKLEYINLPTWGLVIGIVLDVIFILLAIALLSEQITTKRQRKQD